MNLIQKLFGGIFALVGGVLGFLAGLLGLGKKSEYFIELDEAKQPEAVLTSKAATAPVETSVPTTPPSLNGQAPAPQLPAAESVPSATVVAEAPQPVVAASSPAQNGKVKSFAADYLMTPNSQNSRRRPGPSMNPFLDMAKQVAKS